MATGNQLHKVAHLSYSLEEMRRTDPRSARIIYYLKYSNIETNLLVDLLKKYWLVQLENFIIDETCLLGQIIFSIFPVMDFD